MANADVQSNSEVQEEMAAEPIDEDPRVKERYARVALGLIGYDPAADAVWIQIVNDPSVSANARSNLIEDLNEDGFPDPHNPTLDEGINEKLWPSSNEENGSHAIKLVISY